jgi:hypothetical protein
MDLDSGSGFAKPHSDFRKGRSTDHIRLDGNVGTAAREILPGGWVCKKGGEKD